MTSVASTEELLAATSGDSASAAQAGWLNRVVVGLEKIADRLNPILVKETRQALKSRQFVITFLIVLIACWIASFMVVTIAGPDVYFVATGAQMLMVYAAILAFPLMLIVPYTAFRSLASEQEDNTYDLLSITTLSTGQIVTGKLLSAMVQMLVFLSAVSPCIAFTFLLRGVDVLTVATLLGYLILASLAMSMIGLLAGTLAKVRYSQVLVSVLLVIVLTGIFLGSIGMMGAFISGSYLFIRDSNFWLGNFAFLTFYATTFALLHAAASAQIAFSSQNRSTPLRRLMLLQQACFMGWLAAPLSLEGWRYEHFNAVFFFSAMVCGIYWYVMGTLLTSEWPHLSRRVQRDLPQSQLGRTFLTWLNPGPGTGYMLCVSNCTMLSVLGLFMLSVTPTGTLIPGWSADILFFFYTLGWSYVVLYLGVGRLLINFARRFIFVSLTAGFLLHVILLLVGCGGPFLIAYMASAWRFNSPYTLLHITNPLWTMVELLDGGGPATIEAMTALLILGPAALVVLLLNLRVSAAEMQLHRRSLPERVATDEAEMHPVPEPLPANPWEADEASN